MNRIIRCLMIILLIVSIASCSSESKVAQKEAKKDKKEIEFEEKIRQLIENKEDLNKQDKVGLTMLMWACIYNYVDSVSLLLANGANPNLKAKDGSTALHNTISTGVVKQEKKERQQEILKLLIEKGAEVNIRDKIVGKTPLHKAARYGRVDLCQILVDNGADVNARTTAGTTPLHWAAEEGYYKVVQFLLENGANVNSKNVNGDTPLSYALEREYEKLYKSEPDLYENADYDKTIDILQKHGARE